MRISVVVKNNIEIAILDHKNILIKDAQSALDLFATVDYETGCDRMIINKSLVCEDFFDLRTKIAGEVLQKFINYRKKLAIIGDFTGYTSKSLKSFIYECNKGNDIFFLPDEAQAIERLATAD
jgi:hypothetical protein